VICLYAFFENLLSKKKHTFWFHPKHKDSHPSTEPQHRGWTSLRQLWGFNPTPSHLMKPWLGAPYWHVVQCCREVSNASTISSQPHFAIARLRRPLFRWPNPVAWPNPARIAWQGAGTDPKCSLASNKHQAEKMAIRKLSVSKGQSFISIHSHIMGCPLPRWFTTVRAPRSPKHRPISCERGPQWNHRCSG
jgi:hypothetical protein